MSNEPRTPEEFDDAFEEILDLPEQEILDFYVEYGPIDPLEDELEEYTPRHRTLTEAWEAYRHMREAEDCRAPWPGLLCGER
jgi:hypothetical protein